jgi:branched-chain amino acid transport system permease protein
MVIIGGMGNISGVILGAIFLSLVNRDLLPELNTYPEKIGLNFDVTSINFGIFGFLLLVMMVLRPEGFLPSTRRKLELHDAEIEGEEAAPGGAMTPELYEVRHE